MDADQQFRNEIQANWRDLTISRIGQLNGRRVGELGVSDLEWAERRWMPQIRIRWLEVDQEVRAHYYALECAVQSLRPNLGREIPAAPPTPQPSTSPARQSFEFRAPLAPLQETKTPATQLPPAPL